MSRTTQNRRPRAQRCGVVGLGAAAVLAGSTSVAGAAAGVVIPLEPPAVLLSAYAVENFGGDMDPMADPNAGPAPTPVGVLYTGTITVDLPAEIDDSDVEAELTFDDDGDGVSDDTYSTTPGSGETLLVVSGQGTGSIEVTLPVDDSTGVDTATLSLTELGSDFSSAFTSAPLSYDLLFDPAADTDVTVTPGLVAISQVPCDISSATRCPFPTPVTVGSTVTLDLTAGSVLRELGIADLTGAQVGLQQVDANGDPIGAPALLTPEIAGTTASFLIPAGTAAGSYGLVIGQETPTGGISIVAVELTVLAEQTPAVVPPAAEPTTPTANVGLSSNTGVEVVETRSTGTVAVAAGAGLLLLAGAGGVAVVRTRRRPSVEGGTCQA